MERTGGDVAAAIAKASPAARRRDAGTLVEIMGRVTGLEPELWTGNIIGFGEYRYRYESGREGDSPAVAFSPRRTATTIYLSDGVGAHEEALSRLGEHTTGVGCLYLADLSRVDSAVLEGILDASFRTLTAGIYGKRAREGGA